jgi:hypothetical protein
MDNDKTADRPRDQIVGSKPVDRPSRQTVKVRQGTGPRAMVSVLLTSLLMAAVAGIVLLLYFFAWPASTP